MALIKKLRKAVSDLTGFYFAFMYDQYGFFDNEGTYGLFNA